MKKLIMEEKEIELAFVISYNNAEAFLKKKKWQKLFTQKQEITDLYLNPTHRFRFLNHNDKNEIISTEKSKTEKIGARIEENVPVTVDFPKSFQETFERSSKLRVEKTRYLHQTDGKLISIDLIRQPMKIATIEIEFDSIEDYNDHLTRLEKTPLKVKRYL